MRNLTFGQATIILSFVFVTSAVVVVTSFVPALERLRATEDETRQLLFELARYERPTLSILAPEQHADEPRAISSAKAAEPPSLRSAMRSTSRPPSRRTRVVGDGLDDPKCSLEDPICGIKDL